MILKIMLIRAIDLYCGIDSASRSFGIRDRTPKFSLAISTLPRMKSLRIWRTPRFISGQNFLKNPSGPGVVSDFISFTTASSFASEKVS
jgi:hypothetical protein